MDAQLTAGIVNTMMGSMGTSQERQANVDRREIYLPRIATSVLQTVSEVAPHGYHGQRPASCARAR